MGSGWVPAADALGETIAELPFTELPGFAPPAVEGHAGRIRVVECSGRRALVFLGRTHLYEGRGVDAVVHGVRTAPAAGVTTMVLTNAAGGLRPEHRPARRAAGAGRWPAGRAWRRAGPPPAAGVACWAGSCPGCGRSSGLRRGVAGTGPGAADARRAGGDCGRGRRPRARGLVRCTVS